MRKRRGLEGKGRNLDNTDLLELKVLSLQPFVLFDILLGCFLLDINLLVGRGRVLLGIELRGRHHNVPVSRGSHGSVSGRRSPDAHGVWDGWIGGEEKVKRGGHGGDGLMMVVEA